MLSVRARGGGGSGGTKDSQNKMIFDKIIIMSTTSLWGKGLKFCVVHSPLNVNIPGENS